MDLHATLLGFKPYRALMNINPPPFPFTNSVPYFVQIFYLNYSFRYVFPISYSQISISLIKTVAKAIHTLYMKKI